jgi:hypothetical protein
MKTFSWNRKAVEQAKAQGFDNPKPRHLPSLWHEPGYQAVRALSVRVRRARRVCDGRATYTYRVFIETEDANTDAMHYASEKLYEGAIFRVNKPGTLIHGKPVIIYQVDNHPGDETPGIAHARVEVRD